MDNSNDTSSPIHNSHSISPVTQLHDVYQHLACGLYQLLASLHLCSPKPFIKQRCSSLPPNFRQLKNSCRQQLSRTWPNISMVDQGNQAPLPTYQLSPPTLSSPGLPMVDNEQSPPSSKPLAPHALTPSLEQQCVFLLPPFCQPTLDGNSPNFGMNPEKSPMAQLIQEYSSVGIGSQLGSTETSITWMLSLEELTLDLLIDRGEDRIKGLRHYHLVKTAMDKVCVVVTAQQTFVQQAAALLVEGKSRFVVDPRDTLIPILQGTSSLPQLYVAWKVLISRMRLGVKTWEKYIAEYQLQVGATALSPLPTLHC